MESIQRGRRRTGSSTAGGASKALCKDVTALRLAIPFANPLQPVNPPPTHSHTLTLHSLPPAPLSLSLDMQAQVVAADERELNDIRATLNLGHTFGHAIENFAGYGVWLHGEAVAAGTCMAADLSFRMVRSTLPFSALDSLNPSALGRNRMRSYTRSSPGAPHSPAPYRAPYRRAGSTSRCTTESSPSWPAPTCQSSRHPR